MTELSGDKQGGPGAAPHGLHRLHRYFTLAILAAGLAWATRVGLFIHPGFVLFKFLRGLARFLRELKYRCNRCYRCGATHFGPCPRPPKVQCQH
jgi:hypothetical protein